VDQAGWHLSERLTVPRTITLIPLPDNWRSNRIFKSFDDIVDHCCDALNRLVAQPWRIMSIGLSLVYAS